MPGTVAGLVYAEQHFGKLGLARVMSSGHSAGPRGLRALGRGGPQPALAAARAVPRPRTAFSARRPASTRPATASSSRAGPHPGPHCRRIQTTSTTAPWPPQIAAFEQANGGLITASDLAAYQVKERDAAGRPLSRPGSAHLAAAQLRRHRADRNAEHPLRLRPAKLGPDRSPAQIHVITEAFRRAYMDRDRLSRRPGLQQHPLKQMADPAYAAAWRSRSSRSPPTPSRLAGAPGGISAPSACGNGAAHGVAPDHALLGRRRRRQRRLHAPTRSTSALATASPWMGLGSC